MRQGVSVVEQHVIDDNEQIRLVCINYQFIRHSSADYKLVAEDMIILWIPDFKIKQLNAFNEYKKNVNWIFIHEKCKEWKIYFSSIDKLFSFSNLLTRNESRNWFYEYIK